MSRRIPRGFRDWPESLPVRYGPYRALVEYIVDGDTLDATVDVGGRGYPYWTLRLVALGDDGLIRGVDTPEKNRRETAVAGFAAMAYTQSLVPVGSPVLIVTEPDPESLGRWLAAVRMRDGRDLGTVLVAAGHAVYKTYTLTPQRRSSGHLVEPATLGNGRAVARGVDREEMR